MMDMKIFCHFRRVPQVAGHQRRALARAGSCVFPLWGGAFGAVGAQATGITLVVSFHPGTGSDALKTNELTAGPGSHGDIDGGVASPESPERRVLRRGTRNRH